jgi:two-component system, NtrC family, sensor kinase
VVQGDNQRIQQVLLNLLLNAVHAIESAREAGRLNGHQIEVRSELCGRYQEVQVIDTGCGIAPDNLNKLFQPFFTTKDVGKGTGLAMAAKLVNEMKGELKVDSAVGQGTTFTLLLPLSSPSDTAFVD